MVQRGVVICQPMSFLPKFSGFRCWVFDYQVLVEVPDFVAILFVTLPINVIQLDVDTCSDVV